MKIPRWSIYLVLIFAIAVLVFMNISNRNNFNGLMQAMQKSNHYIGELRTLSGIGPLGSTHMHADIAIYAEGKKLDLSKQIYQLKANSVHLEDNNGELIHVHATGITIGHFLNSLGMKITADCLTLDDGRELCSNKEKTLKFFINGKDNKDHGSYVIKDLDKILISYGSESSSEIQKQIDSVTDLTGAKEGKEMVQG